MNAERWPAAPPAGTALLAALGVARQGRVWELSHELFEGMPSHPRHAPFRLELAQRHGDKFRDGGYSAANELISMSGHHGTHIDALGHVSVHGRLFGGVSVDEAQPDRRGLRARHVAELPPFVGRGVLIDVPGSQGRNRLEAGEEITASDISAALRWAGCALEPGDAALIRTGWGALWPTDRFYPPDGAQPGPGEHAARWLADQGIALAGSDTMVFERVVAGQNAMPGHIAMLREHGIPIAEKLYLEELATAGTAVSLLLLLPLRLRGATGSPVRAIAIT
jgi:kynurenine formamidase